MRDSSGRIRAQAIASLAMLHAGIEPIALAMLAATHAARPQDFGWIVGIGQLGLTGGAVLGWRSPGASRGGRAACAAAVPAIGASLALAMASDIATVLAARLVLGIAMGLTFARANAVATRHRAHGAIGTIYFSQQILAAAVMLALPAVARAWGPAAALATLALAPLAIALLLARRGGEAEPGSASHVAAPSPIGMRAPRASLVAMTLLVAVTMMLWSYMSAAGAAIGLAADDLAFAIAMGSLASVPAAAFAAVCAPRFPPVVTGIACGIGMMLPMVTPADAGPTLYLPAMMAFNAGSAFAVVRFSGWAMERRADARGRRFVTAIQCLATAGGPIAGAVAMAAGGLAAVTAIAGLALAAAALLALPGTFVIGRKVLGGEAFAR